MQDAKIDCFEHNGAVTAEIGDLDLRRNLKIRAFVGFVLTPVFHDLQPRLNYAEMGRRGVTPMQYYEDFENCPAPFGYGDQFAAHYEVRLCRSASDGRGPLGEKLRIERLILETRATLTGRPAIGVPAALGYEPDLGAPATAGTGRVLHVLTRPLNPPGQRWVNEIPEEIAVLRPHRLDGPFPTIDLLSTVDDGFAKIDAATEQMHGVWGIANSDVYQHIHAREYIYAMENGITAALATARIPLESYVATRARIIFRRPSFVGQRYVLHVTVYRRDAETVALGAFYPATEQPTVDVARAAVFLRFDGRLS